MCLFCRNLRETRCGCKLCSMPPDRLTHAAILLSTRKLRLTKRRNIGRSWHSLSTSCRSLKSINQTTCHHRGRAPGLVVELGRREMWKDDERLFEKIGTGVRVCLQMTGGRKGDLEMARNWRPKPPPGRGPCRKAAASASMCAAAGFLQIRGLKTRKLKKYPKKITKWKEMYDRGTTRYQCKYVQIRMIQIYTDVWCNMMQYDAIWCYHRCNMMTEYDRWKNPQSCTEVRATMMHLFCLYLSGTGASMSCGIKDELRALHMEFVSMAVHATGTTEICCKL